MVSDREMRTLVGGWWFVQRYWGVAGFKSTLELVQASFCDTRALWMMMFWSGLHRILEYSIVSVVVCTLWSFAGLILCVWRSARYIIDNSTFFLCCAVCCPNTLLPQQQLNPLPRLIISNGGGSFGRVVDTTWLSDPGKRRTWSCWQGDGGLLMDKKDNIIQ